MKRLPIVSLGLLISALATFSAFAMEGKFERGIEKVVNARQALAALIAGDKKYVKEAINHDELARLTGIRPEALEQFTDTALQDPQRLEKEQLKGGGMAACMLIALYLVTHALIPDFEKHSPNTVASLLGAAFFTYLTYVLWQKLGVTPTIKEAGYNIAKEKAEALIDEVLDETEKTSKDKGKEKADQEMFKRQEITPIAKAISNFRNSVTPAQKAFLVNLRRFMKKPKKLLKELSFLYELNEEQDMALSDVLDNSAKEKAHKGFTKLIDLLKDKHLQTLKKRTKLFLAVYAPKLIPRFEKGFIQSLLADKEIMTKIRANQDLSHLMGDQFEALFNQ